MFFNFFLLIKGLILIDECLIMTEVCKICLNEWRHFLNPPPDGTFITLEFPVAIFLIRGSCVSI